MTKKPQNTANCAREILVTGALPYANGPIHIGHMLEYIQADIWVRFQRLRGHKCVFVCADDAHGTPIMIKARQMEISPEELVAQVHKEHVRDFNDFLISFDVYHSTHSDENRELARLVYGRLRDGGHIDTRLIKQAYDEKENVFLPDRFIKGDCPKCGAPNQYGDNCEACGATYSPTDLGNPKSVLSGTTPTERESEHYFFRLEHFADEIQTWLKSSAIQDTVRNKVSEWFGDGLRDWDISRDAPYFGFEIPDAPDKYFYVWLDAPIGYIASFKHLCDKNGLDFNHYWKTDSTTELHHFIGKDIAYFHTLFWPALLSGADFRKPTAVHCHGFITINGQKMSKSRGTFVTVERYLQHLSPEYLRYYFAARLSSGVEDIDLHLDDFIRRVNSDLVGKVVNIASRCASFINEHFDNRILCDKTVTENDLLKRVISEGEAIASCYEATDSAGAVRHIMALADDANRFIDDAKPWQMVKQDGVTADLQRVCSSGLLIFANLCVYLKPILPGLAEKVEHFMNVKFSYWGPPEMDAPEHQCQSFTPLLQRIEKETVEKIFETPMTESKEPVQKKKADTSTGLIDYDVFSKMDLRVGEIKRAEEVEGADKLLQLTIDIGNEERTVFAGIKAAYSPEQLVGRKVVVVANLKPKKMRFGTSEAMVLAAGDDTLFLISPDEGARPGMPVK